MAGDGVERITSFTWMIGPEEFDDGMGKERESQALADDPGWDCAEMRYDWRNHIGRRTRALWATLTPEQRIAVASDAHNRAQNEE